MTEPPEGWPYERAGRRARLPIPVRARIGGGESRDSRLRDVSTSGVRLDWVEPAEPGQSVVIRFAGYPGVCEAFILHGRVVRVIAEPSPAVGIAIDRQETTDEALAQYRRLVLHYIRHRPLLEELYRGFFEGRCEGCGWIGRVGQRKPSCPRCGERVVPIERAGPYSGGSSSGSSAR